ncbi:MAG: hypothetical protein OXU71_12805 [Gammaproteobacteria bacterium]|nr:hypothetical protein [Gammaproteobacteria bacterium]
MLRNFNALASGKIVKILAALFFLEMSVFVIASRDKPKILVLHSYTPAYSWSYDINQGIMRTLDDEAVQSSYHFMATKDANASQKRRAQKIAHRRIADFAPDIILAVDDNASALVAKHYVGDAAIDIIFAGINGSVQPYGYEGAANVTGIYERKPVGALVELINIINRYDGEPSAAVFVSDKSVSAKRDADYMASADWGDSVVYRGHIAADNFADWQNIIRDLPAGIDFLLVGAYRHLKLSADSEQLARPADIARWTVENANNIVIGLNVFNSQDGVPVSVGVSPYEQGEVAAKMALAVIDSGRPAGEFEYAHPTQYFISMNAPAIRSSDRYQDMPALLEAFARSTSNYFQRL